MSRAECDHTRDAFGHRATAITVCRGCRDYLCSICGLTIERHKALYVTNPPVQWRYCTKSACVEAEARYHDLAADEMIQCRNALRIKRLAAETSRGAIDLDFQALRIETRAREIEADARAAFRPERIVVPAPSQPYLDRGEACWCNLGKDCVGNHEIFIGDPVHVCGECGEDFKIDKTDPHWSTGRGPFCPSKRAKP